MIFLMCPLVTFILYADDTNIFCQGNSLENISSLQNSELELINYWLQSNKLSGLMFEYKQNLMHGHDLPS